jgi:hypothetical protein
LGIVRKIDFKLRHSRAGGRLREAEDAQISKLFAQQSRAFCQPQLWNYQEQHATRFKPVICVFQKYGFQPLIVALATFSIVRRIQVEQGNRIRRAPDIHRVALQSLSSQGTCLLCPVGVDLNSVAMDGYVSKQLTECHAISDTGIEGGESFGKTQKALQSFAFGNRKREQASLVWP